MDMMGQSELLLRSSQRNMKIELSQNHDYGSINYLNKAVYFLDTKETMKRKMDFSKSLGGIFIQDLDLDSSQRVRTTEKPTTGKPTNGKRNKREAYQR
jgi:hypothetical protein